MESCRGKDNAIFLALKVIVVFALAAAFFVIVYQHDNKYTAKQPKGRDGVLTLNSDSLAEHPVLFLVDGWEYYSGRLLTPEDFADSLPTPDQYMFIGRFGGFEKWNGGSPHGSASYRINIRIPEQPDVYMLELPEIFSAYRLFINGKQVMQMGEPDPEHYLPQTGNRSLSIEAGGNIELLFSVSDYSHLYSGMVYPPAFGEPDAVSDLLSARLVFRSILCAVALTIGLLSVMVGTFRRKRSVTLLFGLLCIFFVGNISYPITRTLLTGFRLQYMVENISFCAMLGVIMLIAIQVSHLPKKWGTPFVVFGGVICVVSAILHLLLPLGNLQMMMAYSRLISVYEWLVAGFIAVTVWYAIRNGSVNITPLLFGAVVFVCALMADRILPTHEPILTGWFIEWASFVLVICIGEVSRQEVAAQYQQNAVMTERASSMERLYQSQLSHLQTLKAEMEHAKTLRHDFRHHLTIMDEYVKNGKYEKLAEYMKEYRLTTANGELPEYCPINVINILTHHYHETARQSNINLEIRCDLKVAKVPEHTGMSDSDLCCLYSNIMENAVEACQRMQSGKRAIQIAIFRIAPDILNIRVWNTAEYVRQSGGRFLSIKENGQSGYGLLSIQSIAEKYDGNAEFHWNSEKKQFESKIMVMV